jgi:hypothetical protein
LEEKHEEVMRDSRPLKYREGIVLKFGKKKMEKQKP